MMCDIEVKKCKCYLLFFVSWGQLFKTIADLLSIIEHKFQRENSPHLFVISRLVHTIDSSSSTSYASSYTISTWESFSFTSTIVHKWCRWNINTSTSTQSRRRRRRRRRRSGMYLHEKPYCSITSFFLRVSLYLLK